MFFPHTTGWFVQKLLFPQWTWARYGPEKTVYLTFDDGPVPGPTEFVLETLAAFGAAATFFCVGDNIGKHPAIFNKVLEGGHKVGNHTCHHLKGWKTPDAAYFEDIAACEALLPGNGPGKKLFRPPYGQIRRRQAKALLGRYEIVMWDVLSGDFHPKISPQQCFMATARHIRPGSIVVFHDSHKAFRNLEHTLPRFLEHFARQGFRFATL